MKSPTHLKTDDPIPGVSFAFKDGPHSFCGVILSKLITSYLSLYLSLNSLSDEISRTWAKCVITPILWSQLKDCGFKSQSELHNLSLIKWLNHSNDSWKTEGDQMATDFIFVHSKITADGDCSHEIKRRLLFGRKTDKPRQHVKKQRHYFANKGPYRQSYVSPRSHVRMWELDHKKSLSTEELILASCAGEDFWESLWTARKSNQSALKESNPEY